MTPAASQRLQRIDRIRMRRDYERVSREGVRVSTQCFLLLAAARYPAGESGTRLGVTVSRRVGGSVVRSRVKRLIREWFRRSRASLPIARDVVVIARPAAAPLGQQDVDRELDVAARRLRVALASGAGG